MNTGTRDGSCKTATRTAGVTMATAILEQRLPDFACLVGRIV
jgi:hypothetical protein